MLLNFLTIVFLKWLLQTFILPLSDVFKADLLFNHSEHYFDGAVLSSELKTVWSDVQQDLQDSSSVPQHLPKDEGLVFVKLKD